MGYRQPGLQKLHQRPGLCHGHLAQSPSSEASKLGERGLLKHAIVNGTMTSQKGMGIVIK